MIGAGDRAGQVLRAQRRRGPHRVLAGEPIERAPGEERLEGQLPAVLLSDDDHQGRPGITGVGDRVDRVAEARRGVQVDEGGTTPSERVPTCHPHDGALVQPEDEADVAREIGEKRDLGRARVAEDRRHPEPPHDLERGVANRHADNVSDTQASRTRDRIRSAQTGETG